MNVINTAADQPPGDYLSQKKPPWSLLKLRFDEFERDFSLLKTTLGPRCQLHDLYVENRLGAPQIPSQPKS